MVVGGHKEVYVSGGRGTGPHARELGSDAEGHRLCKSSGLFTEQHAQWPKVQVVHRLVFGWVGGEGNGVILLVQGFFAGRGGCLWI